MKCWGGMLFKLDGHSARPVCVHAKLLDLFKTETCVSSIPNSAPIRGRWFRFHLLTAVLITLVSGVLLWMETRPQPLSDAGMDSYSAMEYAAAVYCERYAMEIEGMSVAETEYGWPWIVMRQADHRILMHSRVRVWYVKNAVMDGIVVILMVCVAVFLSEFILRRRNGRTADKRV